MGIIIAVHEVIAPHPTVPRRCPLLSRQLSSREERTKAGEVALLLSGLPLRGDMFLRDQRGSVDAPIQAPSPSIIFYLTSENLHKSSVLLVS